MRKHFLKILSVLFLALALAGCNKGRAAAPLGGENLEKDISYALGMNLAASIQRDGIVPYMDELYQGMIDVMAGRPLRFSVEEGMARLQAAYMELMDQRDLELMQSELVYLAENARKPGIIVTSSGLQYEIIEEGTGEKPGENDVVKVHYDGKFVDGDLFDSSYSRGYPIEFALSDVVPGWMEGMQLMKAGSKYRFYIPSELAYGAYGNGPIPPYSTLVFEVELIEIIK